MPSLSADRFISAGSPLTTGYFQLYSHCSHRKSAQTVLRRRYSVLRGQAELRVHCLREVVDFTHNYAQEVSDAIS